MKTILEFLLSKSHNKVKNDDYYIIWPVGRVFIFMKDDFDNTDYKLKFKSGGDMLEFFILPITKIFDTIETMIGIMGKIAVERDFKLYKIPNGYDEQSIKDAIKTYKVDYKNLERVNIDDLK